MTVDEIYDAFLDEVDEEDDADLKAKFVRVINRISRDIQKFAGVQKTWTVAVVVGTETYTGLSDLHDAYFGRFLATGTTDELANYSKWDALDEYDWDGTGFWVTGGTLYARPKPATAGSLKVYGEKKLAKLNFTDSLGSGEVATPEIDEEFHDVYVVGAAQRYGAQDEDTENGGRYGIYRGEAYELMERMMQRYIEKQAMRR